MSSLRRALSFENVLVTVVAFVALAGGTAYAATHLGKNSVGKKQLKAGSVTTAKIKKGAVTTAKIKNGAITSVKVRDGAIEATALNPETNPFSGIVHVTTSAGTGTLSEPTVTEAAAVPLANSSFTQKAGETIYVEGQLHLETTGACGAGKPKIVFVDVYYDTPDPTKEAPGKEIALAGVLDLLGTHPASVDLPVSSFGVGSIPPPPGPTPRTLTMAVGALCESGAASVSVSAVKLDVIGVK